MTTPAAYAQDLRALGPRTVMTTVPTVDLVIAPDDCDESGRVNESGFLRLFERARWSHLARGAGKEVFTRQGVWPVVRKVTVEFTVPVTSGDRLAVETTLTHQGRTSFSLRQVARRKDGTVAGDAELVMVCVDGKGVPAPVPQDVGGLFGRRPSVRATETRHLSLRGLALAVDAQGDGFPVLFIHGFPLDRTVWRQVTATLTGWRRIAPDLRGMGMSDVPDTFSMSDYADDLAALLDALHVDQAVVCGLSMGGYIAFEMVRRHAKRVRGLILCNTRAEPDTMDGKRRRDEMIALVRREGPGALVDMLLPQLLAPVSLTAMPQVVDHLRTMISHNPSEGVIGALRAMRDRRDARPLLGDIAVPTLVIAGREDQLIPSTASRTLGEAIRGAQFTLIPDAGHLAPLEQPVATSRVIAEFLEAIDWQVTGPGGSRSQSHHNS